MVHSILVIWSSRPQQTTRALTGTGLALNLTTNTGGRYTAIATATAYGRALRQLAADMGTPASVSPPRGSREPVPSALRAP